MKHHLTLKGPLDGDEVRRWLARPLMRLQRRLRNFPADAVHLRTLIRETEDKPLAEASLTLQLPSKTLAADEEAGEPQTALQEAFAELERLLEKEKARLRRADRWQQTREAFHRELLDRAAQDAREELSNAEAKALQSDLDATAHFVRRELRWLEATREIAPGEVDPRDVVDDAFERAARDHTGRPARHRLLQTALVALRAEVARAQASREEIHIEEDVPEVPLEDAISTQGSEFLDFWQPDEDLRMEDLVGGFTATPEEIEATSELGEGLRDALAALPRSWRQAFHLWQVEGFDDAAIGAALEVPPDTVSSLLEHTRAFLRDRLIEAGLLRGARSVRPS